MNKIVREHYPVEKLPEDLRAELGLARMVTVTIEAEQPARDVEFERQRSEVISALRQARASIKEGSNAVSDSVARVRALRDEWDDR